ncbi:MAG: transposase [Ruminococcus sp.]|nr:transposase [Ruminococcus sp.]
MVIYNQQKSDAQHDASGFSYLFNKEYNEKIKDISEEKIAYIYETGIDSYPYREYGYAPRGQKVYDKISGKKFQRTNVIAEKLGNEIIAPM